MTSIYGIARGNLMSAGLVLAAGWVHGAANWILWTGAVTLEIATPILTRQIQGFEFNAAHFAERHGCMLLIVFGESLVSVGLSAQGQPVDAALVLGALAGLAVAAAMWWAYFVGESTKAACAFAAAPQRTRVTHVLTGYELATVVMIAGVIAVAAGTRLRVFRLLEPAPAFEAWLIGGGALFFMLGSAGFRLALGFGSPWPRALGSLLCLIAVPASVYLSTDVGLAAAAVAIAATLVIEHAVERPTRERTGSAAMPFPGAPCGEPS
jgi:low temperature requirement protein LtrA